VVNTVAVSFARLLAPKLILSHGSRFLFGEDTGSPTAGRLTVSRKRLVTGREKLP
jgi:hypothetical protein